MKNNKFTIILTVLCLCACTTRNKPEGSVALTQIKSDTVAEVTVESVKSVTFSYDLADALIGQGCDLEKMSERLPSDLFCCGSEKIELILRHKKV